MTLEMAAEETRIRLHYLKALEENDWDSLPSRFQARGFLKAYAGLLGLDPTPLLLQFDDKPLTSEIDTPPAENKPEPESPSPSTTRQILREIADQLRTTRLQLGFSYEDIERQTHLRVHHLQAMEDGNFEALPSFVQGRGMLGIYARFLGLNEDAVLLRYADALQARLASQQNRTSSSKPRPEQKPQFRSWSWLWSADFLVIIVLTVGILAFFIWGLSSILDTRASTTPTSTPLSIAEVLLAPGTPFLDTPTLPLPSPTDTLIPAALQTIQPEVSGTAPAESPTPQSLPPMVSVYVSVRQRTWLRVLVDGKEQFAGRALPGSVYEYSADEQVEIQTGNAAALQITFNQEDLGTMGNIGEVVTRIYSINGVLAPTATVTLTPTNTPRPSPTPRPTMTTRPTSTPRPTSTLRPTPTP